MASAKWRATIQYNTIQGQGRGLSAAIVLSNSFKQGRAFIITSLARESLTHPRSHSRAKALLWPGFNVSACGLNHQNRFGPIGAQWGTTGSYRGAWFDVMDRRVQPIIRQVHFSPNCFKATTFPEKQFCCAHSHCRFYMQKKYKQVGK